MAQKGDSWNESTTYQDPMTLRRVRRITRTGLYNQTPTYHTNSAFSVDGEFLIFASARDGKSMLCRAHVPTGEITQLIDAVDGVGDTGAYNRMSGSELGDGNGVAGKLCIAPKSLWAVFVAGATLRAVHMETLEERTLIEDIGPQAMFGLPSIDHGEENVVIPTAPTHPQLAAGLRPTHSYMEGYAKGGMRIRLLQVPLAGGEITEIYTEVGCGANHAPHSPEDDDLLLLDRDFPPRFWGGSDGTTNRIWTLRVSTGELTELPPLDDARFQVHCAWTWDGQAICYHGRSAKGGHYIGLTRPNGETIREYGFYDAPHYGHVSAMAGRPAIILDGNLTDDLLLWLYYDSDRPRIEVIARHGTQWGALPGQYSHPHPLSDPNGRWISFNAAQRGRSDVFVVEV